MSSPEDSNCTMRYFEVSFKEQRSPPVSVGVASSYFLELPHFLLRVEIDVQVSYASRTSSELESSTQLRMVGLITNIFDFKDAASSYLDS